MMFAKIEERSAEIMRRFVKNQEKVHSPFLFCPALPDYHGTVPVCGLERTKHVGKTRLTAVFIFFAVSNFALTEK